MPFNWWEGFFYAFDLILEWVKLQNFNSTCCLLEKKKLQ